MDLRVKSLTRDRVSVHDYQPGGPWIYGDDFVGWHLNLAEGEIPGGVNHIKYMFSVTATNNTSRTVCIIHAKPFQLGVWNLESASEVPADGQRHLIFSWAPDNEDNFFGATISNDQGRNIAADGGEGRSHAVLVGNSEGVHMEWYTPEVIKCEVQAIS